MLRRIVCIFLFFSGNAFACADIGPTGSGGLHLFGYYKNLEYNPVIRNGDAHGAAPVEKEMERLSIIKVFLINKGPNPEKFAFTSIHLLDQISDQDSRRREAVVHISLEQRNDPIVGDFEVLPSNLRTFVIRPGESYLLFEGTSRFLEKDEISSEKRVVFQADVGYAKRLGVYPHRLNACIYEINDLPHYWVEYFAANSRNVGGVDSFAK